MKKYRQPLLLAITLSFIALIVFALTGVFAQQPVPHLPDDVAAMRTMPPYELERLFTENPSSIEKITCYKGMRTVVAEVEPLGAALVDYPNTGELIARAKQAHVSVVLAASAGGAPIERFYNSLHWSFWCILSVLVLAFASLFVNEKAFRRIDLFNGLPGMDSHNPAAIEPEKSDRRTFDDIAGCEEAIAKLKRVAKWLESPDWYEQFGAKIPKGVLAVGPPGTGKTLLARALAGEADASFFSVHGSSFVEMFAGVGARRIRKLFANAVAERDRTGKPSIIFIDEIDAIGKKRGQSNSGADSERDQTLNQLLVSMQGFEQSKGIIVMAATNMPDALDEALKRPGRFDYQVNVDLPDTFGREKIFGIHSRKMKLASNISLRELAIRTPQFSGAEIEQACNEAAIAAAERLEPMAHGKSEDERANIEKTITLEDFDVGIDYVQFGDPLLSRARAMSYEDKRNTAYHEAGHTVVQQAMQDQGADPITKVTIEPRTKSLGSMQSHPTSDRYGYTREQLMARITTAMGGRIAQQIFLGKSDTGASNDFEQASNIARLMVTEFGMSRLGPISIKTNHQGQAAGRVGPHLLDEIDEECKTILDECYENARRLILENESRVEKIAQALLEEQTILAERLQALWQSEHDHEPGLLTETPALSS